MFTVVYITALKMQNTVTNKKIKIDILIDYDAVNYNIPSC